MISSWARTKNIDDFFLGSESTIGSAISKEIMGNPLPLPPDQGFLKFFSAGVVPTGPRAEINQYFVTFIV